MGSRIFKGVPCGPGVGNVNGIGSFFFRAKDSNVHFARLNDPEGNPVQLWEPR